MLYIVIITIITFVIIIFWLYLFFICWLSEWYFLSIALFHNLYWYHKPFHQSLYFNGIFHHQVCNYKSFRISPSINNKKQKNFGNLDLLLPLLSSELFTVIVVYLSKFNQFFNNNMSFYNDHSSKSLKTITLI